MKSGQYYLITYECQVMYCLGYALDYKATSFATKLQAYAEKFAVDVGVSADDVYWEYITKSDWCAKMVILHAKVPADWKPIDDCFVFGDSYNPQWYAHLCSNVSSLIAGAGSYIDVFENPPKNPHNLFRTLIRTDIGNLSLQKYLDGLLNLPQKND